MAGESTSGVVEGNDGGKKKGATRDKSRDPLAGMEARLAKLELAMGEALERLEVFEETNGNVESNVLVALNELKALVHDEVAKLRGEITARMEKVEEDSALCKAALAGGAMVRETPSIRAPEPTKYAGKRIAKDLDNFFWSLEMYMDAARIKEDGDKIKTAVLYLCDDAALWWRRRHGDIARGTCRIDTWEEFKADLKRQFYPENVEQLAMKRLRELQHDKSVKEYVNEFTSLMLELPDMAEKDRLFYFLDGLQSWAALELKRRNVQDVAQAIAAAEDLIEFRRDFPRRKDRSPQRERGDGDEQSGGDRPHRTDVGPSFKGKEKARDEGPKKQGCFLCDGPHRARDCPKKKKLNAMFAELEGEPARETEMRLGAMQHLNAMKGKEPAAPEPNDDEIKGGLIFVKARVNGRAASCLVDTGATHNFISKGEATKLGIQFIEEPGWMKAVNAEAKPIWGKAKQVMFQLGGWQGKLDFTVITMEDYGVVLGAEFVDEMETVAFHDAHTMSFTKGKVTYNVPIARSNTNYRMLPSMQLLKAGGSGRLACIASMKRIEGKVATDRHNGKGPRSKSPTRKEPARVPGRQEVVAQGMARKVEGMSRTACRLAKFWDEDYGMARACMRKATKRARKRWTKAKRENGGHPVRRSPLHDETDYCITGQRGRSRVRDTQRRKRERKRPNLDEDVKSLGGGELSRGGFLETGMFRNAPEEPRRRARSPTLRRFT